MLTSDKAICEMNTRELAEEYEVLHEICGK